MMNGNEGRKKSVCLSQYNSHTFQVQGKDKPPSKPAAADT